MSAIWITLGTIAVIFSIVVLIYNNLVAAKQLVDNGWSDIDVQLKRRYELIPNIVETVKAYATHEKQVFIDVTEKRNETLKAGSNLARRGAAETALGQPVTRLLAVAEDYPELKANKNFLDLQDELSETENKIEMARRFYNGAVRELNTKIQSFPAVLLARPFGFTSREYFEIDTASLSNPKIDFKV